MIKMPEFLFDIDLCKMILKLEVLERNAQTVAMLIAYIDIFFV